MKWLVRVGVLLLLCATYSLVRSFCYQQTGGWTMAGIRSHTPFHPEWEVSPLTVVERQEVKDALDQPYHYLASGGQAIVFLSADQRYVIKFFDQKRFQLRFLARYFPDGCFNAKKLARMRWKRSNKKQRDFTSYQLAFEELKHETGLLYVHLNPTEWLIRPFTLVDRLAIAHQMDLNQCAFVLQKRAELVYPYLERLIACGEKQQAKEALLSLLELFARRCDKEIDDSPPDLDKNFGFIDHQAVQIDAGRFTKTPLIRRYRDRNQPLGKEPLQVQFPVIKPSFLLWLEKLDPELLEYFEMHYQQFSEQVN